MAYSFDNISIMKDGKRIFPIMGEIHYSRVPRGEWKERLLKMKAGGVTLVSSYVIWIHHEEIEGEFDWTGDRDLRAFMETVKECGMKMLLRIGPWCHGEVRNGGFPDWLLHKDYEPRTNDERYFAIVKNWYEQIYAQVKDFICNPDDSATSENPIIGVQIENEYGHCGGLYEKEGGEAHMRRLQQIAIESGFKVALYTATGWGGAWTGGMLPVMGGYCDAPWDQRTCEIEPSGNYTFTHERNDHNIGSDHGFGYGITFDIEKFPYLTAELGGGLQVTGHRRTIATAKDIAAVALSKLGSGCNLLGFYMYTGGTNPEGKLTTLQESRATGFLNDLPVKSYDFRAPVREFGQVSDTLRELKLLTCFTAQWGEDLCPLPAEIPSEVKPDDLETLRYAYRSDSKRGYLFVNNYVRHHKLAEHLAVSLKSPDGKTELPQLDIHDGDFFFLPFNMCYGNTLVRTASVTPFTTVKDSSGEIYVFYRRECDKATEKFFDFDGNCSSRFLVLDRKDALNSWRMSDGRLVITDGDSSAIEDEKGRIQIIGRGKGEVCVYPDFESAPDGFRKIGEKNMNVACDMAEVPFAVYAAEKSGSENEMKGGMLPSEKIGAEDGIVSYRLNLSEPMTLLASKKDSVSDCFLSLDYTGEKASLYELKDGAKKLLLDNFYLGEDYPWEIGLKRFVGSGIDFKNLVLEITPLKKNAEIYIEKWPEFSGRESAVLHSVNYEFERTFTL
ncbi:MAG: beta-galactosidase [Treponema sp.]|uniref:beta-galactosidase n=1 Tax=Treponema sp. TaxID=166 RepID=UPI0025FC13D4|nr:beta-galactosidase [Treponema sp.]MBQ9280960.1 beta-galactosidase [Treponema sp.]